MKKIFIAISIVLSSMLITLILLEVVLSFFPVNQGLRAQAVNEYSPIFRFQSNREVQYSKTWNFSLRNNVKTNNVGFVSDFNYNESLTSPLIAIIGDSYVEALMVPFDQTITGITNREAKRAGGRVYSFAASGAGLSQHMVWARYASETFDANAFVFVIIANDIMESLQSYETSPGFHRFQIEDKNKWNMVLSEYKPSVLRKVLRNSNLAMYLATNLKVHARLGIPLILGSRDKRVNYVGNVNFDYSANFWEDSKLAADIYLENLPQWTNLSEDKMIFIIDGIRPDLYSDEALLATRDSFWYKMRKYFIEEATLKGYRVIDMQDIFLENFVENKMKFEFERDLHWNENGHSVVSNALLNSNLWEDIFYH